MPTTNITPAQIEEGLLFSGNLTWGPDDLTFSVPGAGSAWTYSGEPTTGYLTLDDEQAAGFADAIALWDRLIAIDFVETDDVASPGDIRVAFTTHNMSSGLWGFAGSPPPEGGLTLPRNGDVWINAAEAGAGFDTGSFDLSALLHEIGHAIGLDHPFEGGVLPADFDNQRYTVMSYDPLPQGNFAIWTDNGSPGLSIGLTLDTVWAATPMVLDVAAIQSIYGADPLTASGDTTYVFDQNAVYLQTIYDAGGEDTFDLSNLTRASIIDLRPGAYSSVAIYSIEAQRAVIEAQFNPFGFSNFTDLINATIDDDYYTWSNNVGIAFSTTIENVIGSAQDDQIIGNDVANRLTGGLGADTLSGGGNVDTAVFAGNFADYAITTSGFTATVVGADGTDTLTGVEFFEFDDQTFHWRPGAGLSVNFAANPDSFMGEIRDFDGNDLGGNVAGEMGWVLAGQADLQGDGDVEYVFFNRSISRWASVGPAEDGLVYFDDHGWAGDTRVVGIYIDPLVESGDVVQGSDHDSQRRFQNDLFIGNIDDILGADDYDGDGLQEVYFSLTDGTAYLHAYMHADGNIRYANYQNQQQVIDYLADNGFGADTYEGWFD